MYGDRRKPFSSLEKDLLLNIMEKYKTIFSSAYQSRHTWERIAEEFNSSSIVTEQASTNEVAKLWFRLADGESTTDYIDYCYTDRGPYNSEMEPIFAKVLYLGETDANVIYAGYDNEEYWERILYNIKKKPKEEREPLTNVTEIETRTTRKKEISYLKSQVILEEDENTME